MSTQTIAGVAVDVNDEGFFVDPEQWNEAIGAEIARSAGIDPMTDRHWQVVRFMRGSTWRRAPRRPSARSARRRASP